MTGPLQLSITGDPSRAVAIMVGLALLAGLLSALVSIGYRWYVRERAPTGLPVLVGLGGVVLSLNTGRALSQVISGTAQPFDEQVALFNVAAVLVSTAAARVAIDVGDRIASDVFAPTGREVRAEVGRVVQAVGRVITVEIPDDIDDIVGYDPVPDGTKEKLAGRTFVFPRRLTVEELHGRLVARLKADYAVGHVDVDLTGEGEIEYLALGSRAAGIGPTLPPETSAVAIRADPAFSAGAGDVVQVWRTDPPERVLTAEVRGVVDDVVTLAVDAADTRQLDDDTQYKLVTLSVEKRADREFVSLFRAADETMAAVEVAPGSTLAGTSLDATGVTVVAVRATDGPVEPLPPRDRVLAGGDTVYVVATPDTIRRLEVAAAHDPAQADVSPGATLPPEHRIGPGDPVDDADTGTGVSDGDGATAADTGAPADGDDDGEPPDATADTGAVDARSVGTPDSAAGGSAPDSGTTVDPLAESDPDDAFADDWGPPGEMAIDSAAADDAAPDATGADGDDPTPDDTDPDDPTPDDTDPDASEGDDLDAIPGTDVDDLAGADEVLDEADDILGAGGDDTDDGHEDGGGVDDGETDADDGRAVDEGDRDGTDQNGDRS